jgi:protein-S-isoprenylcysteine O-methyltransferase Ste14
MTGMSVSEESPKPRARRGGTWVQRWRVPLGFLCGALFLIFARPRPSTLIAGAIVSILGLLLRGWAAGHIRKNSALATSGPYAFTRNPLYLGSFLLGLGFTIGSGFWPLGILFAVVFLGIYFPVMRVESGTLAELFGQSFQRYAREVPLFLPRVTPYRSGESGNGFDSSLYMRYREYRAALGLVIAWALLVVKAYYFK